MKLTINTAWPPFMNFAEFRCNASLKLIFKLIVKGKTSGVCPHDGTTGVALLGSLWQHLACR